MAVPSPSTQPHKPTQGDAVIKAMVLSGGRGLGTFKNGFKGGVHLATSVGEVKRLAEAMLGHKLVTKQSVREFV